MITFQENLENVVGQYYRFVEGFLLFFIILIFIVSLFLNTNDVKGDTIKEQIRYFANDRYFFVTFVWGVITGHLFLGSYNPLVQPRDGGTNTIISVALLVVVAGILLSIGIFKKVKLDRPAFQLTLLIVGIIFGHFLWSMNGV